MRLGFSVPCLPGNRPISCLVLLIAAWECHWLLLATDRTSSFRLSNAASDHWMPAHRKEWQIVLTGPQRNRTIAIEDHSVIEFFGNEVESAQTISDRTVAYAISVTSCPAVNRTSVVDGPAILAHSIHLASLKSYWDYALYAFIHPTAVDCVEDLERLGYHTKIRDIPFSLDDLQEGLRKNIDLNGCCSSKEFLKLHVYTLVEHKIAVHLDTDVLIMQPLDELFHAMLNTPLRNDSAIASIPTKLPSQIDFFFTRDYLQGSRITKETHKYGVQGGFFLVKPNQTRFDELVRVVKTTEYKKPRGWGNLMYGGYWGAPQIQGFLSYVYGEFYADKAVELNRCVYNAMGNDDPMIHGKCRDGKDTCEDCRTRRVEELKSIHLTTCRKPHECPKLRNPQPPICNDMHLAWFQVRKSLEESWNYSTPTDGWWFKRTLGYCTKAGGAKIRYYVPLQLPNVTR